MKDHSPRRLVPLAHSRHSRAAHADTSAHSRPVVRVRLADHSLRSRHLLRRSHRETTTASSLVFSALHREREPGTGTPAICVLDAAHLGLLLYVVDATVRLQASPRTHIEPKPGADRSPFPLAAFLMARPPSPSHPLPPLLPRPHIDSSHVPPELPMGLPQQKPFTDELKRWCVVAYGAHSRYRNMTSLTQGEDILYVCSLRQVSQHLQIKFRFFFQHTLLQPYRYYCVCGIEWMKNGRSRAERLSIH
ncbi:hypothetical protein C8R44DRAFT_886402 [Mycena epipterygia]|nr:hypothetical protein C8R44DRAFT_886402 [Mycena epipterygia]